MNILIRCDASEKIGTGHVMRCLALAQSFARKNCHIDFVCHDLLSQALKSTIEKSGFSLKLLSDCAPGDDIDLESTKSYAKQSASKILVIDGYHFDHQYQSELSSTSLNTVLIDDSDGSLKSGANFILNQNIWSTNEMYRWSDKSKILAGPQFALFRQEFTDHQKSKIIRKAVKNILVTPGGSDPGNVTPVVIQALDLISNQRIQTRVLLGSMNSHKEKNQQLGSRSRVQIEFYDHVNSMPEFMEWADIAVSGGGFTTFELALMGVPSLFFIETDHQRPNVEAFQAKGMAVNLGFSRDCSPRLIADSLQQLIDDHSTRISFSKRCKTVFDGKGADRVAGYLLAKTVV